MSIYPKIPYLSIYTVKSMILINRTFNGLIKQMSFDAYYKVTIYFEFLKTVFFKFKH